MRINRKTLALAAFPASALTALASATPADFGTFALPIDPATIASAVFAVGGGVLIAVLGLWLGFRLIKKAGRAMGKAA